MKLNSSCLLIIVVFLHTRADAQRPQTPPTTVPRSCTAGGCHAQVVSYTALHGPLKVPSCDACHHLQDAGQHTFVFTRQGKDLCLFCHQMETGAVVHAPLAEGSCLDCHNPHGGPTRSHLRAESTQALCAECHQTTGDEGMQVHRPVAVGGCTACHSPHAANYKGLLVKPPQQLCMDCHVGFLPLLGSSPVLHAPVAESCLNCHEAHAAKEPKLLKQAPRALCLSCHENIRTTVNNSTTQHGALVEGRQCLNCHDPHGTDFPKILRNNPRALCMECHDKPIKTPTGTIPDMSAVLGAGKSLHGPIAKDDCTACHQVHGGDRPRLLVEEYPTAFYVPFQAKSYALCFTCHDRSMLLERRTTTLTDFRNGDLNLHFLHVNQPTKGRTCRVCHETHAGDRPKQIRSRVPYGKWEMPIGFNKTETGGSCTPGCHDATPYDRVRPIDYKP